MGKRPKEKSDAEKMSPVYKVKVPQEILARCEAARGDMSYLSFFGRLLEFFADQTDVIQAFMLGKIPSSIRVDVARLMLNKIAGEELAALRQVEEGGEKIEAAPLRGPDNRADGERDRRGGSK